ncbi:MAG: inorganic phosphate transporter [Lentimicrobiaceae bacterium]|nr:inorganic phosphate transporter [Lentimicrobiaceae bacterium]
MFGLDIWLTILLIICLLAACSFEFINGFHDTANAVATVIYTHSLKPKVAVIWSGMWNFIGVYVGGIAVAMGIVNLLPTEALIDQNIYHGLSMIMALLLTAILWNLGTWYFGIPCSSSHTLIGSIFGVGLAYMLMPGGHSVVLNWNKIGDVGLSLLISPVFGFGFAFILMVILKKLIKNKKIFKDPPEKKAPPLWIRSILILTCTSVSFSHGSNDGQKGIGLVMIILIGIIPFHFALDHTKKPQQLVTSLQRIEFTLSKIDSAKLNKEQLATFHSIQLEIDSIQSYVSHATLFTQVPSKKHFEIRKDILLIAKKSNALISEYNIQYNNIIPSSETKIFKKHIANIKTFTEYSPWWVILMISLSLGLGTMIGWKRIVVTIGERIGKTHLTYAQGATAEIIAASTISVSTWLGLPVSTTHVLSSGVAGSMVADNGLKNLQMKTVKNIAIAWLITLPVTIFLSAILFLLFRMIFS